MRTGKIRYLRSINLFPRATLSIDRRDFQTGGAFMVPHENDPTEPTAAWAVGMEHVTSRHREIRTIPHETASGNTAQ